jgi:integrase/recombinase XerD
LRVPEVDSKAQLHYTIHQLHHTVDSMLIHDLPEQIVSRMLGHRDPRVTRRCVEVNEDQVPSALAAWLL